MSLAAGGTSGPQAGARVMAVLLPPVGGQHPTAVEVDRELVIGRDERCDVVLPSERVSRQHARLRPCPGGAVVEDLESRNGTFLNGRPVMSTSQLHDGDTLSLGDTQLRCRLTSTPIAPPSPRHGTSPSPGSADGVVRTAAPPETPTTSSPHAATLLALGVLESLVGTAVSQAVGTSLVGTYALAAVLPLLGTVFAVRRDGRPSWVLVALVTALAVVLTVVGVTAADSAIGRSVFPWSSNERTFVPPPDTGSVDATQLTMPELVGEDGVGASQLLQRYGFDMRNVLFSQTPSSLDEFGDVIRTEPVAGSMVADDAIVRVYVGDGSSDFP